MSVFAFVIAIIVLGPLAKAIATRISRGGPATLANSELRKTLQATEQRLSETENRLAAVEERLDFYEKLLANPETSHSPTPRSINQ